MNKINSKFKEIKMIIFLIKIKFKYIISTIKDVIIELRNGKNKYFNF
jgi:hypothetical protein